VGGAQGGVLAALELTCSPRWTIPCRYVRKGLRALVAVGSWQKGGGWRGALQLNWTVLGLDPATR